MYLFISIKMLHSCHWNFTSGMCANFLWILTTSQQVAVEGHEQAKRLLQSRLFSASRFLHRLRRGLGSWRSSRRQTESSWRSTRCLSWTCLEQGAQLPGFKVGMLTNSNYWLKSFSFQLIFLIFELIAYQTVTRHFKKTRAHSGVTKVALPKLVIKNEMR